MNFTNVNAKSLLLVTQIFGKKIKKWKHYLPIINLALLTGVVGLSAISVLLVYYPPENSIKSEKYVENISIKNSPLPPLVMDSKPIDYYGLALTNNPFSPNRTAWNPPESKTPSKKEEVEKSQAEQKKPKGTPKKINLRGIVIIGNDKKALIENPDTTKNKNPFIYIEEGDEVAEYKVKSIEEEQIKLDWYGEEQVIVLRSNIKQ